MIHNTEDLMREAVEEMQAMVRAHPDVTLTIPLQSAVALIAHLQLALRHPGSGGPTAEATRSLANSLIRQVAPAGSKMRVMLELGWDPAFDEPV